MDKLSGLQERINKRAEERLKKDLDNWRMEAEKVGDNSIYGLLVRIPGQKDACRWNLFLREAMDVAREFLLPIYIEKESGDFLKQVEELQAQIDELKLQG